MEGVWGHVGGSVVFFSGLLVLFVLWEAGRVAFGCVGDLLIMSLIAEQLPRERFLWSARFSFR
jgi:hypothetical protein